MSANVLAYTRERECEKTIKNLCRRRGRDRIMRAHNAQTRARAAAKAKSLRKIAARRISRMRIMRRRVQAGMVARGLCEEKISTKMPPGGVFVGVLR